MHGNLGNFFDGMFSFDFDFKDPLNQASDDWIDPNTPNLIITRMSDHIKVCVTGHVSIAKQNGVEAKVQGLPLFLKSTEIHTNCKQIMKNDHFRQGIARIDRASNACNPLVDVNIEIAIASLHINLWPGFDFLLNFTNCAWTPFLVTVPPTGKPAGNQAPGNTGAANPGSAAQGGPCATHGDLAM